MGNVLFVNVPNSDNCVNQGPAQCNKTQLQDVNTFSSTVINTLVDAGTSTRPGNGLFLHSCWDHCSESDNRWNTVTVAGMTIAKAVHTWYYEQLGPKASSYVWIDCTLNPSAPGIYWNLEVGN